MRTTSNPLPCPDPATAKLNGREELAVTVPGVPLEISTSSPFPSTFSSDAMIETGMEDGMQISYNRLEDLVAGMDDAA